MFRGLIRKALTKTVVRQVGRGKKVERVDLLPNERLVYGLCFAFLALILLTFLEAIHIVFLRSFSSEIFASITGVIGTIVGVFLVSK